MADEEEMGHLKTLAGDAQQDGRANCPSTLTKLSNEAGINVCKVPPTIPPTDHSIVIKFNTLLTTV
ncbi:hypothetical protein RvY_14627 [Ramazzottius varieornatus]|uniref:Uncharacterized protein n=1 Tax=Ramazzottius varieornatus TaxID=947166 RepID=A0A1D1VS29_RAMVA|nr:hypothetical protein RvY_14627 [Ramazzottius varieornatus]